MRSFLTTVAATAAILAAPTLVRAQADFSIVHNFNSPAPPPSRPSALVEGPDGTFYGVSESGGFYGVGTFFRIAANGTVTVLRDFGRSEGPRDLLLGSDGYFYGKGFYTVFRLTSDGDLTVLHEFTSEDGAPAGGRLVKGVDGNLYGTTSSTVYRLTTAGVFTILHHFASYPTDELTFPSGLVQGSDGTLYGLAFSFNGGAFFRISPGGAFSIVREFDPVQDRCVPGNLIEAGDGSFYGLSGCGNGAIARITSAGEVSVVFSFAPDPHDARPVGLIGAPDGSFYGATWDDYYGFASVYRMAPDHTVSVLRTFNPGEGAPIWPVFFRVADGTLYCLAQEGGAAGRGSVFKLTAAGNLSVVTAFPGEVVRTLPYGLVRAPDGTLYGATNLFSLTEDRRAVFALRPDDGSVNLLHSFTDGEGRGQITLTLGADGQLYGTTLKGNTDSDGSFAFRLTTSGALTLIHQFTTIEGQYPSALLQGRDGNFYGTTNAGGEAGMGTVFRMMPDGATTVLHVFRGGPDDGALSTAPLVQGRDGTLYGTTARGGTTGYGTIFKITTGGSFSVVRSVHVHNSDYTIWMPGVTMASDGNLYGVIPHETNEPSEIFRLTPDGRLYTVLFEFADHRFIPTAPPVEGPDGNLYGFNLPRGYPPPRAYDVYKITLADGHYESLTISGEEAVNPLEFVSGGGDGYLYGTSYAGGGGYVFRMQVPMPTLMVIDAPGPGIQRVTQPFMFNGWALDLTPSPTGGSGVDAVHVWAFPATGAPPIFVGAANYGTSRPDVALAFAGSRFSFSGYELSVRGLAVGTYRLDAFAHSTRTGTFTIARSVTITVPAPYLAIDLPGAGETPPSFTVSGWAVDTAAGFGTGVDVVHVYAYPGSGGAPIFLGAASYGFPYRRPDVGAYFGERFTYSGYTMSVRVLAPGSYTLVVFAHSTVTGAYFAQTRPITVRASGPMMSLEEPLNGSYNIFFLSVSGWAVDANAAAGTGVDAVHVWAYPASGPPVFVGAATYGQQRADVAAALGSYRFTYSGYHLATAFPRGVWTIVVFARSTATGTFNQVRAVSVTF